MRGYYITARQVKIHSNQNTTISYVLQGNKGCNEDICHMIGCIYKTFVAECRAEANQVDQNVIIKMALTAHVYEFLCITRFFFVSDGSMLPSHDNFFFFKYFDILV